MSSKKEGSHGGSSWNTKQVYDLSKTTSDDLFDILESIEYDTDIEDDGLEGDFDDDDSVADPDFCPMEEEVNKCIEFVSEHSALDDADVQELHSAVLRPGSPQPSTSGVLKSDKLQRSPLSVATVLSKPTLAKLSATFLRHQKRSRSTLPESEEEIDVPVSNADPAVSSNPVPVESSAISRRHQKRPRSPLPEFEEGTDIPQPNAGGFTGNANQLVAQSKECKEILWRKKHLQLHKNEVVFRGSTMLPDSFKDLKTPFQCFTHFFTKEFIENISEQTNLYARQQDIETTFTTTAAEIRKYIGILIFMSIYRYPNAAEYWGRYSFEPVRTAMTSKRFYLIRKYLHFNDKSKEKKRDEPGFDPLYKVQPLIKHLNSRFETVPKLPRLCVDEQMCATKMKRTSLRQYMPAKPHKWGFKLFVLCDSSGYSYSFEIFTGAGSNVILPNMPDLGAAANVVVRLSQTIPNFVNHIVYFDNFYTTLPLLIYLRSRGIYSLGTIRSGRIPNCKLPNDSDKQLTKEEKGFSLEYVGNAHGVDLANVLWKDNKNVRLVSTYVGVLPFKSSIQDKQPSKATRFDRSAKKYVEIDCPAIIREYNCHMGGVDLMDGLLGRYHIRLKTCKWTLRLFYHFIDMAMVNAYLLHKRIHKETPSLPVFRAQVAAVLCVNESIKKHPGRPTSASKQKEMPSVNPNKRTYIPEPDIRFDGLNHMPDILDRSGKRMCKNKGCKSETQFFCTKCNLNLCLSATKKCFQEFHTK